MNKFRTTLLEIVYPLSMAGRHAEVIVWLSENAGLYDQRAVLTCLMAAHEAAIRAKGQELPQRVRR